MRILFHHRIASADGQFVHLTELVRALRAAGHDVRVVGPAIDESSTLGDTSRVVQVLKRRVPKPAYELIELAYSLIASARLLRAAVEFRPDAIYERYNLHLHAGRFVARLLRKPFLLEVNSPLALERATFGGLGLEGLARWSEQSAWRSADWVLPVSQALGEHVRAAGVPDARVRIVPNGVDLSDYAQLPDRSQAKQALGLRAEDVVLGFVGFVREWHGLSSVVELAGRRPELPLVLLIVGDGPDARALQQQAAAAGLSERVRVTGSLARDLIPAHLAAFDIALQPAVTPYASPLKLFEYMAAGCAVIAPDSPNIREVLADGQNAVLFGEASSRSFSEALESLCASSELRQRLGEAARHRIRERPFTWAANAALVAELASPANTGSMQHA